MDLDLHQLRALAAAVDEGTFERAAQTLHVTPSAISQRIRALETATGRVLLVRSKPVRATESGESILLLARQIELLAADAAAGLAGHGVDVGDGSPHDGAGRPVEKPTLTVAVNADSLSTWFLPALAPLADLASFHLLREDERRTSELLRDGSAVAAVTTDARPVAGCTVTPLGSMRYLPVAQAAFAARWFPDGPTPAALSRAPVLVFDRDDPLQHAYLARRAGPAQTLSPPSHMIPSSTDFAAAIHLGLGWGMLDELQLPARGRPDELVDLDPGGHIDVPLYWQQWRLRSPSLDGLAAAVVGAARAALRPSAPA
ncbi:MAG: LysR family transcriptional regulator ArgP [Solirubrobacteraceae bacterium]|nr:LysR family transcriptional regulator ArgP [Solirubrobacteraceae bacterium]